MSTYIEKLAAEDVPATQAPRLGEVWVEWLVSMEIIEPTQTDCILGEPGYPPGPRWEDAVESAPSSIEGLGTNGVDVVNDRRVFYNFGMTGTCPQCGNQHPDDSKLTDAVGAWAEGDDEAAVVCPQCEEHVLLTQWKFDPDWAFAHLGLIFHNWHTLSDDFVAACEERIGYELTWISHKL